MTLLEPSPRRVALPPGVRVARGFWDRSRGLLGRRGLGPGEGLLLVPCGAIHTMGMRCPIDAVFLGAPGPDGFCRVIAVRESVPPWRPFVAVRGARMVLEMAAGQARALGLGPGAWALPP